MTATGVCPVNVSKLETLPDELLITIFDNLSARDLMNGFWNLNYRLNTIINSSTICLTIRNKSRASPHEQIDDGIDIFNVFAERLYSLELDYQCAKVDLNRCLRLQKLKIATLSDENLLALCSSTLHYLQHLEIRSIYCGNFEETFFNNLLAKLSPMTTTLIFGKYDFKPKASYQPCMPLKSLSGIRCLWDDLEGVLALFPELRRISISLFCYRENPRWGVLKSMTLFLNNLHIELSVVMVTPDDDPPFHLMICTSLREVRLVASISKKHKHLRLLDVLPQTIRQIENAIDQTKTENMNSGLDNDELQASVDAHIESRLLEFCAHYLSAGWGYIDTESCF